MTLDTGLFYKVNLVTKRTSTDNVFCSVRNCCLDDGHMQVTLDTDSEMDG